MSDYFTDAAGAAASGGDAFYDNAGNIVDSFGNAATIDQAGNVISSVAGSGVGNYGTDIANAAANSGGILSSGGSLLSGAGNFLSKNGGLVGAGITAGASLLGSQAQANAAQNAANIATDAGNKAADLQQARYYQTRADLLPYNQAGQQVLGQIQNNAGAYANNGSGTMAQLAGLMPQQTAGYLNGFVPQNQMASRGMAPGSMTQAELEATPGYQFTLNQGLQATQNSAAARGLGVSGAAMKGAAAYATGLADKTYQDQFAIKQQQFNNAVNLDNMQFTQDQTRYGDIANNFNTGFAQQQQQYTNALNAGQFEQSGLTNSANRLNSVASLGASAAGLTGNAGTQSAYAAGNYLTQGASGAAAGQIASGNAFASGANGLANAFSQYQAGKNLGYY